MAPDKAPPPTQTDIARRAGVSKNTVSLALRNDPQISESTRIRVRKLAHQMGYRKNPVVANLMVQLRASRSGGYNSTIALLNANLDPKAFIRHPTVPLYVEGCRRCATELGYRLDEFWLHDPALDGQRLCKILRARDIRGAVIVGLMNENRLPDRFLPVWEQFPCVVTGVRTQSPALSFSGSDQYMLSLTALQNALNLGYRRPALVLDHVIDKLVNGRFTAGVKIAQQSIPEPQRVRPFYLVNEARKNPELFNQWLRKEKPDLLLTLYNVVKDWVETLGLKVPRDIGLMQLEWRRDHPHWAGMDQHNDIVGEAAMEMVISMIQRNEFGPPPSPRATLIGSTWVPGTTVSSSLVVGGS